jgi:hypothetical protein
MEEDFFGLATVLPGWRSVFDTDRWFVAACVKVSSG